MKQNHQNRGFGLLFFIVFLLLALWPLLEKKQINPYLLTTAFIFLALGLLNSKILTPLNKGWIKFGEILGKVIAPIIMMILYFFILTPISLLVRLFGKDLIGLKFKKNLKTYWIKRKKHLGPMDKQF